MARANIPGLKKSTGTTSFDPLAEGDYEFEITGIKETTIRDKGPGTGFQFTLTVTSGPVQDDGKASKGRKSWHTVDIKTEDHPDMLGKPVEDQPGVHEFKAITVAAGVDMKGDTVNLDSYIGRSVGATVKQTTSKSNGKVYANLRNFRSAED